MTRQETPQERCDTVGLEIVFVIGNVIDPPRIVNVVQHLQDSHLCCCGGNPSDHTTQHSSVADPTATREGRVAVVAATGAFLRSTNDNSVLEFTVFGFRFCRSGSVCFRRKRQRRAGKYRASLPKPRKQPRSSSSSLSSLVVGLCTFLFHPLETNSNQRNREKMPFHGIEETGSNMLTTIAA